MRSRWFDAALAAAALLSSSIINCSEPVGMELDHDGASGSSDVSDNTATTAVPATTTNGLPCDVDVVLATRCQACHGSTPLSGASVSLTSWEDLQKDHGGTKIIELVKQRIHDEARPMPPSPKLDAADLVTLDKWLDRGAKRASETCERTPPTSGKAEPLECDGTATTLRSASPFVMQANSALDEYVCFGIDINRATKHHVVGFGPLVDNAQILHHILVFQAPESIDPNVGPCNPAKAATWTMIGGWAPGAKNRYMPPEAGFPEEAGTTHYVVQLHYNNARGLTGAKDQSGYTICETDKLRRNDAGVLAFGAMNVGPKKPVNIPPRKTKHTVTCSYRWLQSDVTFFSASPHMHKLGRALKSETADGRVLADEQKFDFESQVGFKVSSEVRRGETVKTTCVWSNPSDQAVSWGEGTDDEMCFNFLAYYPKLPSMLSWAQPTIASTCDEE